MLYMVLAVTLKLKKALQNLQTLLLQNLTLNNNNGASAPGDCMKKPHGMAGQKNATKVITKSVRLQIRCTPEEKAAWEKAANGQSLAAWVSDTLNAAS